MKKKKKGKRKGKERKKKNPGGCDGGKECDLFAYRLARSATHWWSRGEREARNAAKNEMDRSESSRTRG